MLAASQIIEVEVQTVAVFGVFCRHKDQDLLVLIPETSWIAAFDSCHQFAEPGDRFIVKIIHVDVESGRVSASIKAVHPDPWAGSQLAPGTDHQARVVRYAEKADRCGDGPGYLIELMPGAYVMLCADGLSLEKDQRCAVTVCESDSSKHAVRVAIKENSGPSR
jgi:predicted RNA-binding protein with RPS1 domain